MQEIYNKKDDMPLSEAEDRMLQAFFRENRPEPEDNGFSERVVQRLPQSAFCYHCLWTVFCVVTGAVVLFYAVDFQSVQKDFYTVMGDFAAMGLTIGNYIYPFLCLMTIAPILIGGFLTLYLDTEGTDHS